jgi:UDP-N-acetylglucosamine 2-epimerase
MLTGIEDVLKEEMPDMVLVYGDTNSTLAGALAASKMHFRVAHVEAGLRSFNRLMPEELNRIVTDHVSDVLLAPTRTAVKNLQAEGLAGKTHLTGDVMYDSVLFFQSGINTEPERYRVEGIPANYLLATLHRAENTDNPVILEQILAAFGKTGQEIVLPVHPRTRNILRTSFSIPSNIHMIEPVGYLQMMKLTLDAGKVLTDSGGLQKEAYFLGKQCITLRMETEWTETLHDGWNILAGSDPEKIRLAVESPLPATPRRQDFGDGNSAATILEILLTS